MRKIRNTIVATLLFASIMLCSANVNAAARVNGTCGNAGVGGISTIGQHKAQGYTFQSGNTGSVKADCTCTYRDVSAGKTRTMTGSSSGTASAEKSFTVYEEDYMKSLVTKHSAVIGAYKWGPSNETTTKATC